MLTKDFINVTFCKEDKSTKKLVKFLYKEYNANLVSIVLEDLQEYSMGENEDNKYTLELVLNKYNTEQEKYYKVDKQYFTCYSDCGCLRIDIEKPLCEVIFYHFINKNGLSKEEVKKQHTKRTQTRLDNLLFISAMLVAEEEKKKVHKEFEELIERQAKAVKENSANLNKEESKELIEFLDKDYKEEVVLQVEEKPDKEKEFTIIVSYYIYNYSMKKYIPLNKEFIPCCAEK